MRDIRRQLDSTQNFAANAPVSFDLPRDNVYKEILLEMRYNNTTAGGEALATPLGRGPWNNVKRIELIGDGKDVIKSYDGPTLHDINWFDFGIYPETDNIDLGAGADSGNHCFMLILSLESVGMEFPQHTWLDARKLSSLELRITWGAGNAEIFTTVTGAPTLAQSITPWGQEILDVDAKSTFSVAQETMQQFSFPTNAGNQRRYRLNVGNAYRRILLSTMDQSARVNVDRLTLTRLMENGIFNRRVWNMGVLKAHNARKKGAMGIRLDAGAANSGNYENPFAPFNTGAGTPAQGTPGGYRNGIYMIDIAEDGAENSLLDTAGYSDLSLELDWNGANTTDLLRIIPTIYIPAVR